MSGIFTRWLCCCCWWCKVSDHQEVLKTSWLHGITTSCCLELLPHLSYGMLLPLKSPKRKFAGDEIEKKTDKRQTPKLWERHRQKLFLSRDKFLRWKFESRSVIYEIIFVDRGRQLEVIKIIMPLNSWIIEAVATIKHYQTAKYSMVFTWGLCWFSRHSLL